MATQVADSSNSFAKRMGWLIVAAALLAPAAMGVAGLLSAFKVGELTGQVVFAWIAVAVVIDLFTRKRDALIKAKGRIVAGTLALVMALVSGVNVYRDTQKVDAAKKELIEQFMTTTVEAKIAAQPVVNSEPSPAAIALQSELAAAPVVLKAADISEADRMVGFMNAMKARVKKFAEDSGSLGRKFNAVDLSTVLAPENIMSKVNIDASRKKLHSYKTMIGERDAMMKQHFVLSEQIIRGSGLTEREVNDALAGLNSNKGTLMQNYANLSRAQLDSVKAIEDILDFAQRELGRIIVQNGQLMFEAQLELDEYQRLMQAMTEAANTEKVITQKVSTQAQKVKQDLVDQLK